MENELDGFGVSFSYGKPLELPGTGKSVIYINTDFNEDLTRKSNKRSCWRKKVIIRNEFTDLYFSQQIIPNRISLYDININEFVKVWSS